MYNYNDKMDESILYASSHSLATSTLFDLCEKLENDKVLEKYSPELHKLYLLRVKYLKKLDRERKASDKREKEVKTVMSKIIDGLSKKEIDCLKDEYQISSVLHDVLYRDDED